MDRFSWSNGLLEINETLVIQQRGVRLYDGDDKVLFFLLWTKFYGVVQRHSSWELRKLTLHIMAVDKGAYERNMNKQWRIVFPFCCSRLSWMSELPCWAPIGWSGGTLKIT